MAEVDVKHIRSSIESALQTKRLDTAIKNQKLLQNYINSQPPSSVVELVMYLKGVEKRCALLLNREADSHVRVGQKGLNIVSEWLQTDELQEFEDEFFNTERLNKIITDYSNQQEEGKSNIDSTEQTKSPIIPNISFSDVKERVQKTASQLRALATTSKDQEEGEEEEGEEDVDSSVNIVTSRKAIREWERCEKEAQYLRHPRFELCEPAQAFLAELACMHGAVCTRMDLEEVRKTILQRSAGRRFARVRAALARNDATIVLRHCDALHEDASILRTQHTGHPAAQMFAERAEALLRLVEERRPTLEAQREAQKEAFLNGAVKPIVKLTKQTNEEEGKIWNDAKSRADATNQRYKQVKPTHQEEGEREEKIRKDTNSETDSIEVYQGDDFVVVDDRIT